MKTKNCIFSLRGFNSPLQLIFQTTPSHSPPQSVNLFQSLIQIHLENFPTLSSKSFQLRLLRCDIYPSNNKLLQGLFKHLCTDYLITRPF